MQQLDIYGTMGPSCQKKEVLVEMFSQGMTGMRWNLSHVTLREAADSIALYQAAARECQITPKLLIDLQGPELRIGSLSENMTLTEGEKIFFTSIEEASRERAIPVPEVVMDCLEKGDAVLLDDGKILIIVESSAEGMVVGCVQRGGILSGRKSVAIRGKDLPVATLTKQDIQNLKDASSFGVTGVMQPFVRNVEDLKTVRKTMNANGCEHIALFAKIENLHGVEHLKEFFDYADEIVIARGDLGNAMPLWKLPGVQKRIASDCRKAGMPFMVVTQMLASMEKSAVPTRAEVSDIYNAVADGASSVMVTGETAVGNYPAETISYLSRTAKEALADRQ